MNESPQPPANGNITASTPGAVVISLLFAVALLFYGVRIYARIHATSKLSTNDCIISVAVLFECIVFVSSMLAISYGFGRYSYYIPDVAQIKILKCIFVVALFGSLAAPVARISIGAMLLRFQISTTRKMITWVLIVIQLALAIGSSLVMFLQCRPIRAFWEPVPDGVCWSNKDSQIYGYTVATMGIFSDLMFAIVPMLFIWSLNRPVLERTLLTVLMGLGLTAAIAGAIRIYYMRTWKFGEEAVKETVTLYMWYRVEEINLISSACAPFLKGAIEGLLRRPGQPQFGFVPLSLEAIRSRSQGASQEVPMREPPPEQELAGNAGQTVSMVSSGRSAEGSYGAKDTR